jgi:hypothetical protein
MQAARPWPNYRQDYHMLVEACKAAGAPIIAANSPRRYTVLAAKRGFAALAAAVPDPTSAGLPPLPPAPGSIGQRWKMAREFLRAYTVQPTLPLEPHGFGADPVCPPPPPLPPLEVCPSCGAHGNAPRVFRGPYAGPPLVEPLHRAQTLWDAAMAHAVAAHVCAHPASTVVHVCGNFHMQEGFGIPEHLERYAPGTRVLTVSTVSADFQQMTDFGAGRSIRDLESHEWVPGTAYTLRELRCLADYVVLTNASLPRTYDATNPLGTPVDPTHPRAPRPRRPDTGNVTGLPQGRYLAWSYLSALGAPVA